MYRLIAFVAFIPIYYEKIKLMKFLNEIYYETTNHCVGGKSATCNKGILLNKGIIVNAQYGSGDSITAD